MKKNNNLSKNHNCRYSSNCHVMLYDIYFQFTSCLILVDKGTFITNLKSKWNSKVTLELGTLKNTASK